MSQRFSNPPGTGISKPASSGSTRLRTLRARSLIWRLSMPAGTARVICRACVGRPWGLVSEEGKAFGSRGKLS